MKAKTSETGAIKAREAGDAGASSMQRNVEHALRSRLQSITNLHIQTLRKIGLEHGLLVALNESFSRGLNEGPERPFTTLRPAWGCAAALFACEQAVPMHEHFSPVTKARFQELSPA